MKEPLTAVAFSDVVSARDAASVSPVSAWVNCRLLKLAAPLEVEALAVEEAPRSASASLRLTVAAPAVKVLPLSVTVTMGAGDMVARAMTLEGCCAVKLSA